VGVLDGTGHAYRAEGNFMELWEWVQGYGKFHTPVDKSTGIREIVYTCGHEYRAMGNLLELRAWIQSCGKFSRSVGKWRELWKEFSNFMYLYIDIYTHIHTHICVYIYTHITHTCVCVCVGLFRSYNDCTHFKLHRSAL
jgi:hypothetical protein